MAELVEHDVPIEGVGIGYKHAVKIAGIDLCERARRGIDDVYVHPVRPKVVRITNARDHRVEDCKCAAGGRRVSGKIGDDGHGEIARHIGLNGALARAERARQGIALGIARGAGAANRYDLLRGACAYLGVGFNSALQV